MKRVSTFHLVTGLFLVLALLGTFQHQALAFAEDVLTKNIKFTAFISELRLILAGISKIDIPFVAGHTNNLVETLEKAQDRLLQSDGIIFVQVMLLSISKSVVVKGILVLLFIGTFIKSMRAIASRLLVLGLAITPGLAIFTLFVYTLAGASKIDFGHAYLSKLEASVNKVRSEKAKLMEAHIQQQKDTDGGKKKHGLKRLTQDVAYDFKKAALGVRGDFSELRLLISEAGHSILSKVVNFGNMIIFCFLILPFGYVVILFTLYKSLFGATGFPLEPKNIENELKSKGRGFWKRFIAGLRAMGKELKSDIEKVEHEEVFSGVENKVKQEISFVGNEFSSFSQSELELARKKLLDKKYEFEEHLKTIENHLHTELHQEETKGNLFLHNTEQKVETEKQGLETEVEQKAKEELSKVNKPLLDL